MKAEKNKQGKSYRADLTGRQIGRKTRKISKGKVTENTRQEGRVEDEKNERGKVTQKIRQEDRVEDEKNKQGKSYRED